MKCEILATGEVKHFPNNDATAHTLIKAGVLRLIQHEPGDLVRAQNGGVFPVMEPPAQPKWTACVTTLHIYADRFDRQGGPGQTAAIIFEIGSTSKEIYAGSPDGAQRFFAGRQIPDDILKQYRTLYKQHGR